MPRTPAGKNPQPRTTTRTRGTPQVKSAGFWTKDWFLGLAVAIVLAVLPMRFELGDPRGKPDRPLPDYVARNTLGRLPFDGESMAQLVCKLGNEPAPDILQFNPRLPPALGAFLDRAMAKEAGERFHTGDEFAQALRAYAGTRQPQVDITV